MLCISINILHNTVLIIYYFLQLSLLNKNKKYLKIVVKYDTINQIHCKKEIIKRGGTFGYVQ